MKGRMRELRRFELVGTEGGEPPLFLVWLLDGEWFGIYTRWSMSRPISAWGPMFERKGQ